MQYLFYIQTTKALTLLLLLPLRLLLIYTGKKPFFKRVASVRTAIPSLRIKPHLSNHTRAVTQRRAISLFPSLARAHRIYRFQRGGRWRGAKESKTDPTSCRSSTLKNMQGSVYSSGVKLNRIYMGFMECVKSLASNIFNSTILQINVQGFYIIELNFEYFRIFYWNLSHFLPLECHPFYKIYLP